MSPVKDSTPSIGRRLNPTSSYSAASTGSTSMEAPMRPLRPVTTTRGFLPAADGAGRGWRAARWRSMVPSRSISAVRNSVLDFLRPNFDALAIFGRFLAGGGGGRRAAALRVRCA
eukprot:COSAG04_NODE_3722_length_2582_cov_3.266319_2_plen_115_part_00